MSRKKSDAKMKVAQVGVEGFGRYRRDRLRETGLFQIIRAYDSNAANLTQCCQEEGAAPAPSYDAMLNTPGIEAVIISTGAKFHAEQVLEAAERGLHVFVEKPVCSNEQEMRALLEVQKRKQLVIGCGHHDHAHDPVALAISRIVKEGELGAIAAFEMTTAHSGGLAIKSGDWRGDPAANPGGMLFQCGVHALHELMFYFGPIAEVSCSMRDDVHSTSTADVAICQLMFQSGLIGSLNAYHVTAYRHTFNVFGTRANLYRDERFFDEGVQLLIQRRLPDNRQEPRLAVKIDGQADACASLRSFYDAVRRGGTCYPSLSDGARAVAVVFAADKAAKLRCAQPVPAID
jgi:predicted dehydrogenase